MKVGILKIFDLIVCLRHKTSFIRHKLKTTYIFWTVNEIEVCSLERWIFCWQFCYSFHQNFKLYYLIHFANHAMSKVKTKTNSREIEFVLVCFICLYHTSQLLIAPYLRYVLFWKGNVLPKNVLFVKKYIVKIQIHL